MLLFCNLGDSRRSIREPAALRWGPRWGYVGDVVAIDIRTPPSIETNGGEGRIALFVNDGRKNRK